MSRLRLFPLTCAHYIMNFVHDRHSPFAMSRLRLFPLSCAHYIINPMILLYVFHHTIAPYRLLSITK